MLEIFTIILTLILVSKYIEVRTNISFVLIILPLAYFVNYLFDLSILKDNFQEILFLMLPIMLIPDILGLSSDELKKNEFNIFFLAVVAVGLSIVMAVGFTYYIDYFHNMPWSYLILLFTPLMATDVVSVDAIFAKFTLPSNLKILAEGESLFNDITAMVIFFFIAIPLSNGADVTPVSLVALTFKTVLFSSILGFLFGYLGYISFTMAKESISEFISVYLMAALAFLIADKLELSAILSVVISILYFKYLFNKNGHYKKRRFVAHLFHLDVANIDSQKTMRAYKKESQYLGFFANAVIFISIASVIDLQLLWSYKNEILYVFVITTIIRYIVLFIFTTYKKLPISWANILTLAGMKGGLALIMIISLSDNFAYKEIFMAIILGVIILSIFFYTFSLMGYLYFRKDENDAKQL